MPADLSVALPLIVTSAVFIAGGLVNRARNKPVDHEVDEMLDYLTTDDTQAAPQADLAARV